MSDFLTRKFSGQSPSAKVDKAQRADAAFLRERERIKAVNAEKTARLKGLRLAKEAVDREAAILAAAQAAADKAARPKKSRTRKAATADTVSE